MADAGDSKSPAPRGHEGSTPSSGTRKLTERGALRNGIQESQASPIPSSSASSCPGLGTVGQLSQMSPTPSMSASS